MTVTASLRAIISDFSHMLQRMGFKKKALNFTKLGDQSYCSVAEGWTTSGTRVWIDVYVGPYFNSTHPIWIGFTVDQKSETAPMELALKNSYLSLDDDHWDGYNISKPADMKRLSRHSYQTREKYRDHDYVWLGRYFTEDSKAEDYFTFVRRWLALTEVSPGHRKASRQNDDKPTTKKAVVFVRTAQIAFREDVRFAWNYRCAVTDLDFDPALRASHILPWSDYPQHRTNLNNGLLLAATYDALFDRGFISFKNSGQIMISRAFPKEWQTQLNVKATDRLRQTTRCDPQPFLKLHRELIYLGD